MENNGYFRSIANSLFPGRPNIGILRSSRGARKPATPNSRGGKEGARLCKSGRQEHTATRLPGPALSLPARPGPAQWGTTVFSGQIWRRGVQKPCGTQRPEWCLTAWRAGSPPVQPRTPLPGARCQCHEVLFFPEKNRPSVPGRWRFITFPSPAPRGRRRDMGSG